MKRQPALYTFKVWLWSATLSPIVAAVLQFYYQHANSIGVDSLEAYPAIVFLELLITVLLWILFWALTALFSNLLKDDIAFRWTASITGLIIASALCWLISQIASCSLGNIFFDITLANCLCIFAGCWYFNIGKPATSTNLPTINTDTHEQTTQ